MKLIEAVIFLIFLPIFANFAFSGLKKAQESEEKYIFLAEKFYEEKEIVNSFRKFCTKGEDFEKKGGEIERIAFKDKKTLLKMKWNDMEVFGVQGERFEVWCEGK